MRHSGRAIHFLVELIDRSANRGLVSAGISLARTNQSLHGKRSHLPKSLS